MKQTHVSRLGFLWCAVVLLVVLTGCSQDVFVPATGTVYGTLVHDDGQPAAGVLVIVEFTDLSTVTDGAGRFVINGLLAVDPQGMGKYYNLRGEGERQGSPVGFFLPHFKIKGQQSYSTGTVVVRATGEIRGRVIMADQPQGDNSGVSIGLAGTSLATVTRADGSFTLAAVPAYSGYVVPCLREGYRELVLEDMIVDGQVLPIGVAPAQVTDLDFRILEPLP